MCSEFGQGGETLRLRAVSAGSLQYRSLNQSRHLGVTAVKAGTADIMGDERRYPRVHVVADRAPISRSANDMRTTHEA